MLNRRSLLGSALATAAVPLDTAGGRVPGHSADLRARALAIMAAHNVPGAGIAVVKDGEAIVVEGLGFASIPFAVPARPNSLFHLGSVSKQFTAATVVALAREGRIDLDAPIGSHAKGLPATLANVSIRSLLSHTSGIPDYEGLPGFDPDRSIDRTTFVRKIAEMAIDFPPGVAWRYSNSGYLLLGYLIADVTGGSYHDAVTSRLLRPAGLQDSRFDAARTIIPGRTEPYVLEGDDVRHAIQMDSDYSGWPDGGLLMSPRDAARWEAGLQNGSVVPAGDLNLMTRAVSSSIGNSIGYGMGWFTDRVHGRDVQYHSGSVPGFLSFYIRVPSLHLGVIVMANMESGPASLALRRIAIDLAEAIAPGSTYRSLPTLRDDDPALTRSALAMILRGRSPLDAARFAPEIARLLPDRAGGVGPPDRARLGTPQRFDLVEAFDEGAGRVRRYRAVFPDRTEHIAFAYDRSGLIFRVRTV